MSTEIFQNKIHDLETLMMK